MNNHPLTILFIFIISLYLANLWIKDYKLNRAGHPNPKALPGATITSKTAISIAIIGAIVIVVLETLGEQFLGVSEKQSNITWLFLLAMLSAGFLEEILFRGFLVINNKGQKVLLLSIVGFSALFALIHFHWLKWGSENGGIKLEMSHESVWWTSILFINSLWFYYVRFFSLNPNHSLLPCFAAHITSNLGVFAVKLLQGHVTTLY